MLFFTDRHLDGDEIRLSEEDQRHLNAFRPRIGDKIPLSDGEAFTYTGIMTGADKKGFTLTVTNPVPIPEEPHPVTVYLPLLKGDSDEKVIRESVELGASRIVLYQSENCVASAAGKESAKTERFKKVAKMASMQSGSPRIPGIEGILSFSEAKDRLLLENGLFFYENATLLLSDYLQKVSPAPTKFSFMTGPEGGFSSAEAEAIRSSGIPLLSLGSRILKAETAPVAVLAVLRAFMGEL